MLMKTVFVTGGNSGIVKATVAGLAQRGWQVVFTARNLHKAESVKREIIQRSGNEMVDYIVVDLTSLYLDSSKELKYVSGKYFVRRKIKALKNPFLTDENRKVLWQKSLKLSSMAN